MFVTSDWRKAIQLAYLTVHIAKSQSAASNQNRLNVLEMQKFAKSLQGIEQECWSLVGAPSGSVNRFLLKLIMKHSLYCHEGAETMQDLATHHYTHFPGMQGRGYALMRSKLPLPASPDFRPPAPATELPRGRLLPSLTRCTGRRRLRYGPLPAASPWCPDGPPSRPLPPAACAS